MLGILRVNVLHVEDRRFGNWYRWKFRPFQDLLDILGDVLLAETETIPVKGQSPFSTRERFLDGFQQDPQEFFCGDLSQEVRRPRPLKPLSKHALERGESMRVQGLQEPGQPGGYD